MAVPAMPKDEARPDLPATPGDVTAALHAWQAGDSSALERLVPLVYSTLHRMAERRMRGERANHTLQPSAIVNEAYLKLAGGRHEAWADRTHFFLVAGRVMRQVLVDHARRRAAQKRGEPVAVSKIETVPMDSPSVVDVIAVNDALDKLAILDPEQARVVELRFFSGLTIEETATALQTSTATVQRKWAVAKAWLHRELVGPTR
jgi:RNA polymerase sigma factor (TIGR02999 family)